MYYMHSGYQTSIFGKNCAYYIRIFTVCSRYLVVFEHELLTLLFVFFIYRITGKAYRCQRCHIHDYMCLYVICVQVLWVQNNGSSYVHFVLKIELHYTVFR